MFEGKEEKYKEDKEGRESNKFADSVASGLVFEVNDLGIRFNVNLAEGDGSFLKIGFIFAVKISRPAIIINFGKDELI